MTTKKIPMRMCLGCREMKPKRELIRVVKTPEGDIVLDTTGKKNGRGAYICPCGDCFKKAQKQNAFSHTFSIRVEQSVYESLEAELKSREE